MGVASGVESFDGASPQPLPVKSAVPKGANAPAPAIPNMAGTPPLAKFNPLVTGATTKQALDSRPETSALRPTRAAVDRFAGDNL